jgi:hypothetical protein
MDWDKVPVEGEAAKASEQYMSEQAAQKAAQESQAETDKSVLSPNYRPRSALGMQEIGGLAGSVIGGIAGLPLGPLGVAAGSTLGAGIGGAGGEALAQYTGDEPISGKLITKAGLEEAAWDAGGNLVLKGAAKTLRFGADKLGFTKKDIPDANAAAEAFLQKQGSSLPLAARTGTNLDTTLEGLAYTPATFALFAKKQQEITQALQTGQKDVVKQFTGTPEFEQALRSGSSAQKASGEVLFNFMKAGTDSLNKAVEPLYKEIFADTESKVGTFPLNAWAGRLLQNPSALTAGQKTILKEIKSLPPSLDFNTMHQIRSRWLAENRDKYSGTGTEKDSLASKTIGQLVDQIDNAMDAAAASTLSKDTLAEYKKVTKTYRQGIQGLQSEAIAKAMTLNAEDVGGYLFRAGNETPIADLYKSVAAAGTLSKKSSKEVLDSLRVGYLDAMTHTPENMLTFAKELEQSKATQNTFNVLFGGTPQKQAILDMNEAAKRGLIQPEYIPGVRGRTGVAIGNVGLAGATVLGAYAFALSPEQQQAARDNAAGVATTGLALVLTQRQLAKLMLDPKGAKTVSYLSKAKERTLSPSGFTKLVVEPINNILGPKTEEPLFSTEPKGKVDWANVPTE